MKWHIGDSVRFLNEPITGMIRELKTDGWAEVETKDGMVLSVPTNQLVRIHGLEKILGEDPGYIDDQFKKDLPGILPPPKKLGEDNLREFDLHIEEMGVAWRGLNNFEILRIQINFFENKLGESIRNHISPITFIHGVGNGVLRQEIQKRLKNNIYVSHFQDKGKDRNGFGATEVFLKP